MAAAAEGGAGLEAWDAMHARLGGRLEALAARRDAAYAEVEEARRAQLELGRRLAAMQAELLGACEARDGATRRLDAKAAAEARVCAQLRLLLCALAGKPLPPPATASASARAAAAAAAAEPPGREDAEVAGLLAASAATAATAATAAVAEEEPVEDAEELVAQLRRLALSVARLLQSERQRAGTAAEGRDALEAELGTARRDAAAAAEAGVQAAARRAALEEALAAARAEAEAEREAATHARATAEAAHAREEAEAAATAATELADARTACASLRHELRQHETVQQEAAEVAEAAARAARGKLDEEREATRGAEAALVETQAEATRMRSYLRQKAIESVALQEERRVAVEAAQRLQSEVAAVRAHEERMRLHLEELEAELGAQRTAQLRHGIAERAAAEFGNGNGAAAAAAGSTAAPRRAVARTPAASRPAPPPHDGFAQSPWCSPPLYPPSAVPTREPPTPLPRPGGLGAADDDEFEPPPAVLPDGSPYPPPQEQQPTQTPSAPTTASVSWAPGFTPQPKTKTPATGDSSAAAALSQQPLMSEKQPALSTADHSWDPRRQQDSRGFAAPKPWASPSKSTGKASPSKAAGGLGGARGRSSTGAPSSRRLAPPDFRRLDSVESEDWGISCSLAATTTPSRTMAAQLPPTRHTRR